MVVIGEKTPLLLSLQSQRRVDERQTTKRSTTRTGRSHRTATAIYNNDDYDDNKDDESRLCVCGTHDRAGIWWSDDWSGSFLAVAVWMSYVAVIGTILARTNHMVWSAMLCTTGGLALASHAKTALTDPGTVPRSAAVVAVGQQQRSTTNTAAPPRTYCVLCQTAKPIYAHHCRTCKRCICRLDHHCPWVKNCIGAANMKHFVLFLVYTFLSSLLALIESVHLDYVVGVLVSMFGLVFGTYILYHSTVIYIRTGLGAIDRLQVQQQRQVGKQQQRPVPTRALLWSEIFGSNVWVWWLPVDPRFRDPEKVFGYTLSVGTAVLDDYRWSPRMSNRDTHSTRSHTNNHLHGRVYQTQQWEFPSEAVDI